MLTVLYDADCPLCSRFRDWLAAQPMLVPVQLVAAGSGEARRRFPALDHERTLREITVVGDDGSVWTNEHAWVMCLWATWAHRALAERLARPAWLPLAKGAAYSAAGLRHLLAPSRVDGGGDYPDRCAGSCSPLPQG
jgi:predicted DCC family thiol-disulfide oxidoreductase YuxK